MLNVKLIRENPEKIKEGIKKRGLKERIVDDFLVLDEKWRSITQKLDEGRARQNILSKERKIDEAKIIKDEIKSYEVELHKIEEERRVLLNDLPNIPAEDVPVGKNEKDNIVLREVGDKIKFDFIPKNYLEIAEKMDAIDITRAANIAGSRFGYLKNKAALLELALIQFSFNKLVNKGFIPIIPPVMIKSDVYERIGRLAADQKEERYFLEKDDVYLVGSAEHTLVPLHMNETLRDVDLPKHYVGFSTCFRREAGSYGKDTKGILRVHQFDKVELVVFCKPEDSEKEHQLLLACQEEIVQELKLPYRVVQICTGDMGWTDYKQYDIETWMPGQPNSTGSGQGEYRETHSCSNTTDFQTRGVNCKYEKGDFVHALNATAISIQRTIIAIIENYQTADGSFEIPKVLEKYFIVG